MPKDPDKTSGPPEEVIEKLVEIHSNNGTLDNVLASGIGDEINDSIASFTALLRGRNEIVGTELFSYDGGESVNLVADLNPGIFSSNPGQYGGLVSYNGDIYFSALVSGASGTGWDLFKLEADTGSIASLDLVAGSGSSYAGQYGGFLEWNNALYFTSYDPSDGYELRMMDSAGIVTSVTDIASGTASSYAGAFGFGLLNDKLYFSAIGDVGGRELYSVDSTGVVSLVEDINEGTGNSQAGIFTGFVEFGGDLFFAAIDETIGWELHKIEGDTGEVEAFDINMGGGNSFAGRADGFTIWGDKMYFSATTNSIGSELWSIDLSGNLEFIDINLGSAGSSPGTQGDMVVIGDALYFDATDATYGDELRRLTYNELGDPVIETFDLDPGAASSNPGINNVDFFVFNDDLWFTARDTTHGLELRKLDTDTGVITTFDALSGVDDGRGRVLGVVNDTLAIAVDTDPTSGQTWQMLVSDLPEPTSLADFTPVDDGTGTFQPGDGGFLYVGEDVFMFA